MLTVQGWQCFTDLRTEQKESKYTGGSNALGSTSEILRRRLKGNNTHTHKHIHNAYFWRVRKSYYNSIVRCLEHMGSSSILEGAILKVWYWRWRACSAIHWESCFGRHLIWLFQLPSPSRCCYGTRIVSEGFHRTQSVRTNQKIILCITFKCFLLHEPKDLLQINSEPVPSASEWANVTFDAAC